MGCLTNLDIVHGQPGPTCSLSLNVSANVGIPVMLAITIVAHFLAGAKEKACSRTIKPADGEAVNQKKREVELKMQVHSLKHQHRQMKRENAHKLYPQKCEALEKQL